jgi:hypothetical protein
LHKNQRLHQDRVSPRRRKLEPTRRLPEEATTAFLVCFLTSGVWVLSEVLK